MKVVINACHGGFSLSHEAMMRYGEIKGTPFYPEHDIKFGSFNIVTYWTMTKEQRPKGVDQSNWNAMSLEERVASNKAISDATVYDREIPRNDPALVQVVEEMGKDANGRCADLEIVEIPDDVKWSIENYDGKEWVAEVHRTWS